MDKGYEAYCAAHPLFYDSVTAGRAAGPQFSVLDRVLPEGWRRRAHGEWLHIDAPAVELPAQGWKIHVSGCLENAGRVLETVWDYCVAREICFKFLRSPKTVLMRNAKYAPRAGSGKLITIYPLDEHMLRQILEDLDGKLSGEPGPYILSDLRFADGPLYVRYGGFALRHCLSADGVLVPALAEPDGTLVPDVREPVFRTPGWLTLPDFLATHLAARTAATVAEMPYRVESVLHFSNGGGLYRGVHTGTGAQVVLKEARPHAGIDGHGADAVTRLRRERDMLRRLSGVPCIPRLLDYFEMSGHEFLVEEYLDGQPLNKELAQRLPLTTVDAGPDDYAAHVAWARSVLEQTGRAVAAMHERGVVHGDLHLFNLLVRPDGGVVVLDFEVASLVDENGRSALGNQGFASRHRTGTDADLYALACLRLALFLPLTALVPLAPGKARHLADVAAGLYPLPDGFLDEAVQVIDPEPARAAQVPLALPAQPADWPDVRDQLHRAILASATPERTDRLFPADIAVFASGGGLGIAHGAAGVLYALAATGAQRRPEYEQWLLTQAADPPHGTRFGYLDGLCGVAHVLDFLGYRQQALDIVERCLAERWERLGLDLAGGVSGIGLSLLHLAARTGENGLRAAADRAVELVLDRLGPADSVPETSGGGHPYAGLTQGACGPALLLMRMYDRTGERALLDRAGVALEQELRRCTRRPDGSVQVNEGWRSMPYLAQGSAGIGLVLDEYLRRRPDERLAGFRDAIALAARFPLYVQPGLFAGRAGLVLYLACDDRADPDGELRRAQIQRLAWHAVPYAGGLAFPGEQLLRLSMDVATGTAGVLLALAVAQAGQPLDPLVLGPGRCARSAEDVHAITRG